MDHTRIPKNTHKHKTQVVSPNYDWEAFHNGNVIQRWWKKKIRNIVSDYIGESTSILDVGCGSSPLLSTLTSLQKVGIDTNASKIDFMKSKDPDSTYLHYTREIPFHSEYFRTVTCIEVLEHLDKPEELLAEISRVTKVGGTVILATPDFSSWRWNAIEVIYGLVMPEGYHHDHHTKFTESSLFTLTRIYRLALQESTKVGGADIIAKFVKY